MSLWQLSPTAEPGDARWRGHPVWDDVIVRAATPAEAFAVAAALLGDFGDGQAPAARDMFRLREIPPAEDRDLEGTILSLRLRGRRPAEATAPASPATP